MPLSFNGIPWSNLRGYCFSPDAINPQVPAQLDGSPTSQDTFTSFWKNLRAPTYPIQANAGRLDLIGWPGFYNGGYTYNPSQTYPNSTAVQQYINAIDSALSWADAGGISLIINSAFTPGSGGTASFLPSLKLLSSSAVWQPWYNNSPYPGTESPYQGMSFWDACWAGFGLPLLNIVKNHPCVIGLKIDNEPGHNGELSFSSNPNLLLHNVGNYFAQKVRAAGSNIPIVYQTINEQNVSLGAIQGAAPSSTYSPLIFSTHYPTTTLMSSIQGWYTQVPGCVGWYIDEAIYLNGWDAAHVQACATLGIPAPFAHKFGNHSLTPAGLPNANCLTISSVNAQYLGAAQYFTSSPIPLAINSISAVPSNALTSQNIMFSVSATGGTIPYSYSWNFGDGNTSIMQNPTHSYSIAQSYNATATVKDAINTQVSANVGVTITTNPNPRPTSLVLNVISL